MAASVLRSCSIVLVLAAYVSSSSRTARILPPAVYNNAPDLVLSAGYPGWNKPTFRKAPKPAEGRFLYYRKNPKVEKYRSAVHELYMRPYNYADFEHSAVAVVKGEKVAGVVRFQQSGPASPLRITGNLTGLSPGLHGFHIHQLGDTTNGCKSMAGHFNPNKVTHGAPTDIYRHSGDLGNIKAGLDGVAVFDTLDKHLSLNGISSIIGRGVVVHQGEDDLGRGGDSGSKKTGNAGGRVACGVIGLSSQAV